MRKETRRDRSQEETGVKKRQEPKDRRQKTGKKETRDRIQETGDKRRKIRDGK